MVPDFWEKHADDLTDQLRPVYETGRRALAWQYRAIIRRNRLFEQAMREWFKPFDYLLTPAVGPAPRIDSIPVRINRGGNVTGYFTPFNHAHMPAAAVPFGLHSNGMPLSVQIVGPRGDDVGVLRMSAAIERPSPGRTAGPRSPRTSRSQTGRAAAPSVILVLDTGIHAPRPGFPPARE